MAELQFKGASGERVEVSAATPLPVTGGGGGGGGDGAVTGPLGTRAAAEAVSVTLSTENLARLPTALGSAAAAASLAVTASTEDIARVGIVTETAPASDTASSGLNGRLQRIAQNLTTLLSPGKAASATFTPAATSHAAGDCNGAAAEFALGTVSGCTFVITTASLEIDGGSAEATAWLLYLFNVTPPSAVADDGAFTLASGDRASFLGVISLGTALDIGDTQYIESNPNKCVKLAGTSVFGYLVNATTLTPANVAHKVTLIGTPL